MRRRRILECVPSKRRRKGQDGSKDGDSVQLSSSLLPSIILMRKARYDGIL